jgi:hypothetical protein
MLEPRFDKRLPTSAAKRVIADSPLRAFRIELFDCALGKIAHGGKRPVLRWAINRLDNRSVSDESAIN